MRAFVEDLLRLDAAPVVTATVALDRRRPGSPDGRIRFQNLIAEAKVQLTAMADRASAQRIADRLDDAVFGRFGSERGVAA
jgi:hypothetical protein